MLGERLRGEGAARTWSEKSERLENGCKGWALKTRCCRRRRPREEEVVQEAEAEASGSRVMRRARC